MRRVGSAVRSGVRGFYDAADGNSNLENHYQKADSGSADAHANPTSRKVLRERARYEVANNGWLSGINKTWIGDLVGRCPRLCVNSSKDDKDDLPSQKDAETVDELFFSWMKNVGFPKNFRKQLGARRRDGEGIGVAYIIPEPERKDYKDKVPLGYRVVDCDRLADPDAISFDSSILADESKKNYVDGVSLDKYGEPIRYDFLRDHPGRFAADSFLQQSSAEPIEAKWVFHLFDQERPEQHRGVTEYRAALNPALHLRQFAVSTLKSARNAARLGGVVESEEEEEFNETDELGNPIPSVKEDGVVPGTDFSLNDDEWLFLPRGCSIKQVKSENPNSEFDAFTKMNINEMARPLCVPFGKAALNHSDYNYSSSRADHQDYFRCIGIERFDLECEVLDRLFAIWWQLAAEIKDYLPTSMVKVERRDSKTNTDIYVVPDHCWRWDGVGENDPLKEAKASTEKFRNGTDNPKAHANRSGESWAQKVREGAESFGCTEDEYLALVREWTFGISKPINTLGLDRTNPVSSEVDDDEIDDDEDSTSFKAEQLQKLRDARFAADNDPVANALLTES